MTVSAAVPVTSSTGNGVTTVFPFAFKILSAADLRVLVNGAVVTNYTVTGVGAATGSITFTAAPANGATVIIRRAMTFARATDYQFNGSLPADTLNADQDAPVLMLQQISEAVSRTLRAPESDPAALTELPAIATRANLLLGFDSNGQPIATAPVAGSASALATQLASSSGSSGVGFLQSGTGAVSRTVQDKLREQAVTPYDFNCVAGVAADQTTNMQRAINEAASIGVPLDLLNLSWRIDGQLTIPSNTEICNGTLDASFATSGTKLMVGAGTLGSGINFTASTRGAGSITLASNPGWTRGDFVYLRSSDAFGSGGTHRGEWVRVNTCTTTLTPYGRTLDAYTTSPQAFRPTLVENVTLRNLRLRGRGNTFNQYAAQFYLCRNVHIKDVVSEFYGDRHIEFNRCVDSYAANSTMAHCDSATGLAYGVVIAAGCSSVTVNNCTFRDMRHGVTVGSNDGVDRNITVTGCVATDCTDAGFDTHPHSQFVTFVGNTINSQGLATGGSGDGIVMQGANQVCTGNTVMGFTRVGILIQNLVTNSAITDDNAVVSNNSVSFPIGSGPIYGISVENQRTVNGWRFAVSGNAVDVTNVTNSYGIWCEIVSGGSTNLSMSITGNQVYARRNALTLQTATLKLMRTISVTGNTLESLDTTTYDALFINSASANYIERAIITGNSIYGGRYGINNVQGQRIKVDANMIQAFGTAATNGTIVGTNDNYSL